MNPVSVVIPVYNEADCLPELFSRLDKLFAGWPRSHELIFVDDGSSDQSQALLREEADKNPAVILVRFARNFGQQAAITAGFEQTQYEIVVVMDSDLQVDPADIPVLVEKIEEGYDVVAGFREFRAEKWQRRMVSWIANKFLSWYFKLPYRDIGCGLQAFRKKYLEGPERFTTMYGHAAIFAVWRGGRFTDVPIVNHPRPTGSTKWSWINLLQFFLDIILTFNISPVQLTLFFVTGTSLFGFGIFLGILGAVMGAVGGHWSILTLVFSIASIMVGLQLVSLGFLNERISRIDRQIQKTPIFVVDEIYNSSQKGREDGTTH